MGKRGRRIGEILVSTNVVNQEQLNTALEIQKKEAGGSSSTRKVIILVFICILFALFAYNLNRNKNIIIREAKIVTGVDKDMAPLKVTNFFPKNTSKVSAWINWKNAKINAQVLFKWHYVTDDIPIYDYMLNIPKREGIANVILSLPEGKSLPSGSYKVTILSGKKRLTKPLTFEIQ